MVDWVARYEEGFIAHDGREVTVSEETFESTPWASPDEALVHWSSREDLSGRDVVRLGNGLQQVHDVAERPEFKALRIAKIWRRVTFEIF